MKKTTILLIVSFFAFHIGSTQNIEGIITYQASLNSEAYLERLDKDTEIPEFRRKIRLKEVKTAVPSNFHLFFNKNESLYKAEHDLATLKRLGLLQNKTSGVAGYHFTYYTNKLTKECYYQSFWVDKLLVKPEPIVWNLTQETKKIGKYVCFKATTVIDSEQTYGMNFMNPVVAWYTPQIPISSGIQYFNGLPGLTMELTVDVEKGKLLYRAIKIELNPKEKIKIKKPKGKQISEKKFVALVKQMNGNR